jgi:hypothetical protein
MSPSEDRVREKIRSVMAGSLTGTNAIDALVQIVDEEVRNAILTMAKVYGRNPSLPDEFNPIVSVK